VGFDNRQLPERGVAPQDIEYGRWILPGEDAEILQQPIATVALALELENPLAIRRCADDQTTECQPVGVFRFDAVLIFAHRQPIRTDNQTAECNDSCATTPVTSPLSASFICLRLTGSPSQTQFIC
jgi:hypothetical protein